MKTRKFFLNAFIVLSISLLNAFSFAQTPGVVRCYTDEQDAILRANNPQLESKAQFEQWVQSEIAYNQSTGKVIGGVYQIPVVFHVVHNGEAVGSGTNISYAAMQSQIDVLNEDFRRIFGSNGWNTNPVGADTQIEFCLAKRRPDGSAFPGGEDGVNRINRSTAGFSAPPYSTAYIDATIKPYTYNGGVPTATRGWVPDKYMNIWICNISGGILGYAQFPQSPLGGMGCGTPAAATDGVVFLYNSIGKSAVTGFPAPYNEGRTATHEIGHWLGLRHIWGDGGCTIDDYCNDTPEAATANYGCPAGTNSCTAAPDQGPDMIENYMDYTDDLCMSVFTNDQKQRMRAVLEGSPMRLSLINSDACTPPNTADASITDVFNPKGDHCPGPITPSVQLRNRGSNNLTSAVIKYQVDNGTPVSFSWSGNLAPNTSATVGLPAFTSPLGNHTFIAYSTLPNGVSDPATQFDTSGISFAVSNGIMPNYTQDFEGQTFPPDLKWVVDNTNGDCFKWSPASGMSSTGVFTNNIAQVPCYGNSSTSNEDLYTPIFTLPCNATVATLKFDVAYRKRTTTSNDKLDLQISTDCGTTWTTVYSKSGNVSPFLYQNAATFSNEYFPTDANDWKTETIDLISYVGSTSKQVRFRFRGVSANGNNIFIDNVKFEGTYPAEIDVNVSGLQVLDGGFYNFVNTQVGGTTTATFTVQNTGTSNLILTNPITVTGTGFTLNTGFGTTTVTPGSSTTFSINFSPASAGNFTGNVSFATNDCDEGTFNFILNGTGVLTPPIADFTASQTTICQGTTITFTNTSQFASTYAWTFTGGTPGTSTATNPTVTYNTAGTYAVTLVATNANGSDTETKNAYITVLSSTASALPLTEGFTGTFLPTGWTLVNNNNSPTTWAKTTAAGNAPTTGNAMWFDNYGYNDSDDDVVKVKPLNFSSLSAAQLTFDVAYARYNAGNFDGLEVLVSSDCGFSFTSVYSKSSSTLATAPDVTSAFTPTSAQWRTETVDLTAFINQSSVIVAFKNLSGYGNNLYVDNINISGTPVSSPPTASFTASSTTICAGQSVTYTNTSTGNPTSYSWNLTGGTPSSSTATNPTVVYNTPGTYTVALTATNGAGSNTSTQTNMITVNPVPSAPTISAGGPISFCAGGSVTLTSTAGNTYLWSTGATTASITVTTAGTYTCQVTNASGCQSAASNAITVTVNSAPSAPTISAGGPITFCAGGSVTLTSTAGNTYLWSPGGATTASISAITSGTYTCQVTNASGCQSPASNAITVTVNPAPSAPTISAGGPIAFCAGGSVTLTSSAGSSYLWNPGGATTSSISVNSSGTYTCKITNASGCQSAASNAITVTVNSAPSAPTISAGGPITFCAGGSVTLTSTAGNTYLWSPGGATTASISAITSGTYTCQVTNASGCQSPASNAIAVTVNPTPSAPTITAGGPTTFCAGGSVTLTSSAGSSYLWNPGGATTSSISVNSSGTYTCKVTNASGCQSAASNSISVTVNPVPTISLGSSSNPSACGTNTGSVTINGTGAGTLAWSGTATGSTSVVSLPTTVNNLMAGSYSFVLTSAAGCSSTSLGVGLTDPGAPTPPVVTASNLILCSGGSVTLTSDYATGNTWSTGAILTSITVTTAGTYTVAVTVTGCTSTSLPITITDATPFSVNAGLDSSICIGSSIALTGTAPGGIALAWDNSVSNGVSFVPTATTTYTLTGTDGDGCQNTDQVTVTVNNLPVVTLAPFTMVCDYTPVFTLSGGNPTGGIYSGTAVTAGNFDPAAAGIGTFTITYNYTDANGCSASAQNSITVDECLAVGENDKEQLILYPNPTNGKVNIQSSMVGQQVELFDDKGRMLTTFTITHTEQVFDMSMYSNGQYIMRVQSDNSVHNYKIVLNR